MSGTPVQFVRKPVTYSKWNTRDTLCILVDKWVGRGQRTAGRLSQCLNSQSSTKQQQSMGRTERTVELTNYRRSTSRWTVTSRFKTLASYWLTQHWTTHQLSARCAAYDIDCMAVNATLDKVTVSQLINYIITLTRNKIRKEHVLVVLVLTEIISIAWRAACLQTQPNLKQSRYKHQINTNNQIEQNDMCTRRRATAVKSHHDIKQII